jgi:hypothetical protein
LAWFVRVFFDLQYGFVCQSLFGAAPQPHPPHTPHISLTSTVQLLWESSPCQGATIVRVQLMPPTKFPNLERFPNLET